MSRVTLEHIAREVGLSKATVSRVLSGQAALHKIRSDTEQTVLEAAKRLGYTRLKTIYRHKELHTHRLGLVVPDLSHFFLGQLTRTIVSNAKEAGFSVMVCDSLEDTQTEIEAVERLMAQDMDGLIVLPVGKAWKHLQQLAHQGIPLVVLDRVAPDIDCHRVCVDNYKGAFEAVDYLIHRGHSSIACIQRLPHSWISDQRVQGYRDAHEKHGIAVEDELILGDLYGQRNGYLETQKVLQRKEVPTAIFSLSHLVTLGVLRALNEHHLTVPTDMSLIGFDDLPHAEYFAYPITTVTQPITDMALAALDLLLDEIHCPTQRDSMTMRLPTTLVRRQSVCALSERAAKGQKG